MSRGTRCLPEVYLKDGEFQGDQDLCFHLRRLAGEIFESFERTLLNLDLASEEVSYKFQNERILHMWLDGTIE
jgi:hypothetical protein